MIYVMSSPVRAQYQICSENLGTFPIKLPEIPPCTVPEEEKMVERKVTLYLPITVPKYFPVYSCQRRVFEGCTESVLMFWREITRMTPSMQSTSPQDCEKFLGQRDKTLVRLEEYKWGTRNPDEFEYAVVGERCTLSVNDYIEKGEGGVLNGELLTSWGTV